MSQCSDLTCSLLLLVGTKTQCGETEALQVKTWGCSKKTMLRFVCLKTSELLQLQ